SVRVAVRSPERARNVLPDPDHVQVLRADVRDPASVAAAVAGADAVVNAVSAYVEKAGVSFESVHVQGARTLAQEAFAAGVARLVLVSRIRAAPPSPSPYIRARRRPGARSRRGRRSRAPPSCGLARCSVRATPCSARSRTSSACLPSCL